MCFTSIPLSYCSVPAGAKVLSLRATAPMLDGWGNLSNQTCRVKIESVYHRQAYGARPAGVWVVVRREGASQSYEVPRELITHVSAFVEVSE